jgi:DNA-binding Lrp family transcriptional regulator
MTEIARGLHHRSETVSGHIRSLKEREFYAGTMGLLCYQKIDMAYVPVLVRAPLANLETIYETCRAHPYIEYSVRTLGATDGAFLIFTPPHKAVPLVVKFLDELTARGIITDYRIHVCDDMKRAFLQANLSIFNPQTFSWEFNWNKWQGENETHETSTNGGQLQELFVEPSLYNLERSDIQLLSILSDDARLEIEQIAKATNLPPHTVRRRIQALEDDGFIIGYRAMIAYSKFHLSSSTLFDCSATSVEVEKCKRNLLSLPFPGTFIAVQNGFLCQATLPAEGLPFVHRNLLQHCSNVQVSWFDLPTSDVALLNKTAYEETGWRTDEAYMIEEPLSVLDKKRKTECRAMDLNLNPKFNY